MKSDTTLRTMPFPDRLAALRKARGLTQQGLADAIGSSKIQIYRYEGGASQPTLDTLKRLAIELGVSTDELVFDAEERGPDDDLKLQFEALSRFDDEHKKIARAVLDGLILKHQANRLSSGQ
ncbi:MAG: helix-turn-helix transcriptional regulator [Thermoanaerobaculia bacterium]|nr:helix-turn-helix transcriptional regulator [Thermoanaerobaculia bacterium]